MSEILKFDNYKEQKEPKLGCLMLYFAFSNWKEFIRKLIKGEDIYTDEQDPKNDYGYEDEAHCTILFGFQHYDGITDNIKKYLPELEELDDIVRGNITLFEQENYDVVKFDIHSEKLKNLNKKLCDNFEYINEHIDYHPHMTIAYVKKGEGAKYINENLKEVPLFGDTYIYSDPNYNKIEIQI